MNKEQWLEVLRQTHGIKTSDTLINICERIGYGAVMQFAEAAWGAKNNDGAELTVGPCAVSLVPCICNGTSSCDWCCGSGRVTKKVSEVQGVLNET